jgi:hypothetical protein
MEELCCALVNTSLTTAIGFVAFAFSPVEPVRAFGIFTAVGVVFCLVWSLTVTPALLVLIRPARFLKASKIKEEISVESSWFARLAGAVVRKRYVVVAMVVLVAALTPFGLQRLVIQDSWIDGFDPASEFSRATRLVNEQFRGMHLLYLCVDAGRVWQGDLPASAVAYSQFSLPADLAGNPQDLLGQQIIISIVNRPNPGMPTNVAPRSYWRSVIESAVPRDGRLLVRTADKDANASIWLDLPRAERIHFEIGSQPHLHPSTLYRIAALEEFIKQHHRYGVGGVLSAADYVATTSFMVRPNDERSRRIPPDSLQVKTMWDYYRIVRGERRLRELVDAAYARSLTAVFLREANFIDTARLMDAIRAYEGEQLAPHGIKLGFAGDVAVSQSLIKSIVTTQLQSLVGSLAGILALTSLLGRSLRWGVCCVIPSALAVLINFAVMGWMGIPLGVATSMFAGMTLGIGVDFAIHVLEGFGLARSNGSTPASALRVAMARTGPPVLINTLAVALGFGVLIFSQVPANARLGLLVVLGLVNCLIASLLLLPVLLHWWPLSGSGRKSTDAHELSKVNGAAASRSC